MIERFHAYADSDNLLDEWTSYTRPSSYEILALSDAAKYGPYGLQLQTNSTDVPYLRKTISLQSSKSFAIGYWVNVANMSTAQRTLHMSINGFNAYQEIRRTSTTSTIRACSRPAAPEGQPGVPEQFTQTITIPYQTWIWVVAVYKWQTVPSTSFRIYLYIEGMLVSSSQEITTGAVVPALGYVQLNLTSVAASLSTLWFDDVVLYEYEVGEELIPPNPPEHSNRRIRILCNQ